MITWSSESRPGKNPAKLIFFVLILTVLTTGCTAWHKDAADAMALVSDDPNTLAYDPDFDLLEEELAAKEVTVPDPLKPFNWLMYAFNDKLYFWVVKPATQTYANITPRPARIGIRNFFNNLTTPVRYVNCLLQGKGKAAGIESDRFLINTTVGILGFGDPAKDRYGKEPQDEDLGQTLAVHGVGEGCYLVLPLFGPSTARDALGQVGDLFLNPIFYVEPTEAAVGIGATRRVNDTSFHIGDYESFKEAAVDPYIAMYEAYMQYRNKQIGQ